MFWGQGVYQLVGLLMILKGQLKIQLKEKTNEI